MAKRTQKRKRTLQDLVEACTRLESNVLDQEQPKAESEIYPVDSLAEKMFLDGQDVLLDGQSDPDWKPDTVLAEVHVKLEEEPGPSRQPSPPQGMWFDDKKPDITPTLPPFCPTRTPGPQLTGTSDYTVPQHIGQDVLVDRQSDPDWKPDSVLAEVHVKLEEQSNPDWKPDSVLAEVHVKLEEEPGPPPKTPRLEGRTRRGRGRGRIRGKGRGARQPSPPQGMWFDVKKPDITPTLPPFCPTRTPGPQLTGTSDYTVPQHIGQDVLLDRQSDPDWKPDSVLAEVHVELEEQSDPDSEPDSVLAEVHDNLEDDPDWKPDSVLAEVHDNLEEQSDPDSEPDSVLAEVHDNLEEEPGPPPKTPRLEGRTRRGRGRGRIRGKGRGARQPSPPQGMWFDVKKPDITPTLPPFCPKRTPGPQLISTSDYTVLQLFQQFFTSTVLLTLVENTNVYGRSTYPTWVDITLEDMFSFLALVIYMGLLKVPAFTDYWKNGRLYSLPFPRSVLSGTKYLSILHALHLSSPKDDAKNEAKRGTAEFDRLGKIKPLYTEMRIACRQNYQPDQHISVDERMVASKARIGFKQYIKNKPVRWGYKLFVIADSKTGYTWDFFVYEGKNTQGSKKGLGYDSVMSLVNTSLLGTGYKLYVDNFYTSPVLFRDLLQKKISACGTIRTNRKLNSTQLFKNTLDSKAPRGSIRWIREDHLLFVQWRDTRDVFMCSTMHTAHGEETVARKVKDDAGHWTVKDIPIPPAIKDYNKHMGGVDLSDALIGYYEVLHKTKTWYKTFFYHFVDIAIVNAFILYKAQCKAKNIEPLNQKGFRETLVLELADAGSTTRTQQQEERKRKDHCLVHISSGGDKTKGRLRCRKCHAKTPFKCATCDISLCFLPNRDCYNEWHKERHKERLE